MASAGTTRRTARSLDRAEYDPPQRAERRFGRAKSDPRPRASRNRNDALPPIESANSLESTSRDILQHGPCGPGTNIYGKVLGATADETILVGLQMFKKIGFAQSVPTSNPQATEQIDQSGRTSGENSRGGSRYEEGGRSPRSGGGSFGRESHPVAMADDYPTHGSSKMERTDRYDVHEEHYSEEEIFGDGGLNRSITSRTSDQSIGPENRTSFDETFGDEEMRHESSQTDNIGSYRPSFRKRDSETSTDWGQPISHVDSQTETEARGSYGTRGSMTAREPCPNSKSKSTTGESSRKSIEDAFRRYSIENNEPSPHDSEGSEDVDVSNEIHEEHYHSDSNDKDGEEFHSSSSGKSGGIMKNSRSSNESRATRESHHSQSIRGSSSSHGSRNIQDSHHSQSIRASSGSHGSHSTPSSHHSRSIHGSREGYSSGEEKALSTSQEGVCGTVSEGQFYKCGSKVSQPSSGRMSVKSVRSEPSPSRSREEKHSNSSRSNESRKSDRSRDRVEKEDSRSHGSGSQRAHISSNESDDRRSQRSRETVRGGKSMESVKSAGSRSQHRESREDSRRGSSPRDSPRSGSGASEEIKLQLSRSQRETMKPKGSPSILKDSSSSSKEKSDSPDSLSCTCTYSVSSPEKTDRNSQEIAVRLSKQNSCCSCCSCGKKKDYVCPERKSCFKATSKVCEICCRDSKRSDLQMARTPSQKKVRLCCDCSTSTSSCLTAAISNSYGQMQKGDGYALQGKVRYSITKITDFGEFTTFEVMKSTRRMPKTMPTSLEGVFVLRRAKSGT